MSFPRDKPPPLPAHWTPEQALAIFESPMATSNSPTYGHPNSPRQDGRDYESRVAVARRAAASFSR